VQTRILVVEDEADAREGLRMLLEASGYAVETAADGVDGLTKLLDGPPDAAVVDIDLPGLNGYELARRARAAPASRGVRLIALTGYGREKDRRAAAEAGFDRHLTKPITFSILRGALDGTAVPPAPASGTPPASTPESKTRVGGGNRATALATAAAPATATAPASATAASPAAVDTTPIAAEPLAAAADTAAGTMEAVPIEAVPIEAVPIEAVPIEAVPMEAVPAEAAPACEGTPTAEALSSA
jgi:CheY-like chemotaxis protein